MKRCLFLFLALVVACSGEGVTNVDCAGACTGKCGTVQGCDCGSCDVGEECRGDSCPTCSPACDGKECGSDGCDGTCGSCIEENICVEGLCEMPCDPTCGMAECGDDGCGGSCGECSGQTYCNDGLCLSSCSPQCEDRECGDDGCDGSCGDCPGAAPLCVEGVCHADCDDACANKECGNDGCGGSCGECLEGEVCLANGTCLCQPACDDNECGDDGCGGNCGSCNGEQESCQEGQCVCAPDCNDKECGDDGCDGQCGECPPSHDCLESGSCICVPDCNGKECGGDGCTGLCGDCDCGENCSLAGLCLFTACVDKVCGSDGCDGNCGSCEEGQYCVAGICPPAGEICFDDNDVDWDGCTAGDLSEFQVNVVTDAAQTAPAVGVAADGSFLIAWESSGEDGNGPGVFARAFDGEGQAMGDPLGVNQEAYGAQKRVAVAALTSGWVAVWESTGQDGSLEGIFARRVSANGKAVGDEFPVNQFTEYSQTFPAVVALPGGFQALWQSPSKDGSGTAVVARRFLADGSPDGDEFVINEELLSDQGGAAASGFADGRLAVAWNSFQQDGSNWGIAARRFAATGEPSGVEFMANETTSNSQVWSTVAVLNSTDFVVGWQSLGQDSEDFGVYGQRFGELYKLGGEVALHETEVGEQAELALSTIDGGFAAVWQSCPALGSQEPPQDGDGCGIYWRKFSSKAIPSFGEREVNIFTSGNQRRPAMGAGDGTVVVAWESCPIGGLVGGQDGDACGVFARRFDSAGTALYH
jgi:hypothetical protein